MHKWLCAIPLSELLGDAMTRDLSGGSGARDGKVCDGYTLVGDETMVVASLDVHGVLHQPSPLEAQLQTTLNIVPVYAWYALPNGALTFVNERTADYLGLPKEHPLRFGTATGADWDSHIPLLHPDDREETRRVWSNCLRTGCAGEVTFRVRIAEGGYRWFLNCVEPIRAADRTLLYWIGLNLDIEERKQAEFYIGEGQRHERLTQELQRREAYFAEAQRLSHTGSFGWNVSTAEHLWSDETFRIFECDPRAKPTLEFVLSRIHPDDREAVQQQIDRATCDGEGFGFEHRLQRFGRSRRTRGEIG